jgi:hypothetical protein
MCFMSPEEKNALLTIESGKCVYFSDETNKYIYKSRFSFLYKQYNKFMAYSTVWNT